MTTEHQQPQPLPPGTDLAGPMASGGLVPGDLFFNDSSLDAVADADLLALLILAGGASPSPVVDADTQEHMNKLTHYLMGIGGSIVCCLGTVANAMSVAVLTRRAMKSSTYMYLAALAICDSLVLFFTLLLVLKDTKPPQSSHPLSTYHAILFPFVHPTAIVFQVTSIWLTLAFTVDRYIMICHPFKAEHMCRRSRARKVVVGIYVGGLLFNIPKYLEHHTRLDEFKLANTTQVYKAYGVMTTDIGNNELFRKIVHSWGYLVFVCGIPFLTLVVLNAFLIRAVRESRLKGKEINPREKHRNDTTVMLIGVIIIFLICQGPALASRMIYSFDPSSTRNKAVFTLNEVSSFLVILNSAINIVPYYLFGRKFRSEFWRIFCACVLDKDELRRMVRTYSVSMDQRRASNYNVMEMNGLGPSTTSLASRTSRRPSPHHPPADKPAGPGGDRSGGGVGRDASPADEKEKRKSANGVSGRYLALPVMHYKNRTGPSPSPSPSAPPPPAGDDSSVYSCSISSDSSSATDHRQGLDLGQRRRKSRGESPLLPPPPQPSLFPPPPPPLPPPSYELVCWLGSRAETAEGPADSLHVADRVSSTNLEPGADGEVSEGSKGSTTPRHVTPASGRTGGSKTTL